MVKLLPVVRASENGACEWSPGFGLTEGANDAGELVK